MRPIIRALAIGGLLVAAPAAASVCSASLAVERLTASRHRELGLAEWVVTLAAVALATVLAWLAVQAGAGVATAISSIGLRGHRRGQTVLASHRSAVAAAVAALVLLAAGVGTAAAAQAPRSVAASPWQLGEHAGIPVRAPVAAAPASPQAVAGWTPQVSTVAPATAELVVGHPAGASAQPHVVVRGDTLWSIAAHRLGPEATAAEIAALWPRWWQANLDVIGADPDLILPGQQLRPPA